MADVRVEVRPLLSAEAFAPLIIAATEVVDFDMDGDTMIIVGRRGARRYYFWFFGYVAKLPYESEIEEVGLNFRWGLAQSDP